MDRDELRGRLDTLAAEVILDPERMKGLATTWAAGFWSYSLGNCLLIYFQRPGASVCAGFNLWKSKGRHVKAGEKGLAILAPVIAGGRRRESPARGQALAFGDQATGPEVTDDGRGDRRAAAPGALLGFRVVYVFDIGQTEGAPLDIGANRVKGQAAVTLEAAAAAWPEFPLELVESLADGMTDGRSVRVARRANKGQEVVAFFHELGHVLLEHVGPEAKRRDVPRDVREVEAEAVAYLCGAALGLQSESSADYIRHYDGDRAALDRSGVKVLQTAEKILRRLGVFEGRPEVEEVAR